MNLKNRLEKLDNHLTAKQYIMLMVEEMQQYDSFERYLAAYVIGRWDQLRNDFDKVIVGIRNKMKGENKQKIEHAISKAYKEGTFLYLLLGRVIASFQQEHYRHAYNGLTLLHLWQSAQNRSLRLLANKETNLEELQESMEEIREILSTFQARAKRHLYHLLMESRRAEEISRLYFGGRELMFEADRKMLAAMTKQAMGIISQAEDIASELVLLTDRESFGENGPPPLVDVDAIRAEVERDLDQHVQHEVDIARAEVFGHIGKLDQWLDIYRKYGS
jgi:hypothetical protein